MSGALVIRVSQLPPASSSLNARVHWAQRYRDTLGKGGYGQAVYYEAVDLRNRLGYSFRPLYRARVDLTFVFREKRRRDPDNLVTRFKSGLDALVQADLLTDDRADLITISPPKIEVDPTRAPQTIIALSEVR